MKLRNKIHLSTSVLFIGLFIIINFSVYFIFSNLILNSELEQAGEEAEKNAEAITASLGEEISAVTLVRAYAPVNGMIQIITSDKQKAAQSVTPSEKKLVDRKVQFYNEQRIERIKYDGKHYAFNSIPIILQNGDVANLQIYNSIQMTVEDLAVLRLVLISVTIIVLIPVVLSSRILSNLITKPIISLIETMTDIRKSGQFKRIELEESSKDELYEMRETFNHMIDLLETNFEKQDQFVANASHELRTPLTIIESYSSLLKRRGLNEPDLFHESIEAIHSESIRMKDMIEQLLLLAKHDAEWKIQKDVIDLGIHVAETVKAFESAYHREIQLQISKEKIMTLADEQKLKQLSYIILDNARKYSEDEITVEVGLRKGHPYIQISDKGIGIPKEDLPKIFDRFFRVDKARSRKMGGSGLGLSLARDIAEAMNAVMSLDSLEGIGTTVTIELPAYDHFSEK